MFLSGFSRAGAFLDDFCHLLLRPLKIPFFLWLLNLYRISSRFLSDVASGLRCDSSGKAARAR